jgi:hypothetical protein
MVSERAKSEASKVVLQRLAGSFTYLLRSSRSSLCAVHLPISFLVHPTLAFFTRARLVPERGRGKRMVPKR